eukprot:CAMPEP_0194489012 /NCGR_PEP_ID=MMETSP0253-20130528/8723_1 /TAXON_ID=2966 /ORGANISM="Noctiluca scintillans" /LENGTH=80 /DNA_ID=CAMNT_0039329439 /DNA_START=92 /DNA_END=334 /DNA_ORIENTATION=-
MHDGMPPAIEHDFVKDETHAEADKDEPTLKPNKPVSPHCDRCEVQRDRNQLADHAQVPSLGLRPRIKQNYGIHVPNQRHG